MSYVRHRIDGLEMQAAGVNTTNAVRHRIDGLENYAVLFMQS